MKRSWRVPYSRAGLVLGATCPKSDIPTALAELYALKDGTCGNPHHRRTRSDGDTACYDRTLHTSPNGTTCVVANACEGVVRKLVVLSYFERQDLRDMVGGEGAVLADLACCDFRHPNIVHQFAFGYTLSNSLLLTQELLPGHELFDEMADDPLPLPLALYYAQQILAALSFLHDQCVAHGDVKPENMFVHGETLKVVDFGGAVQLPPNFPTGSRYELVQLYGGTVEYAPPECSVTEWTWQDPSAADVYGAGRVMELMLWRQYGTEDGDIVVVSPRLSGAQQRLSNQYWHLVQAMTHEDHCKRPTAARAHQCVNHMITKLHKQKLCKKLGL